MPRLRPWADATPAEMATGFATAAARWRRVLAWDTADLWPALERARTTGRLDGLVRRDAAGALSGWTYYVGRDGDLVCGALAAATPDDTAALVDALLATPAAANASRTVIFAFSDAPALDEVLRARSFISDPYHYLVRALPTGARRGGEARPWDVRDLDATAELLRVSYGAHDPVRPFVPHGRASEWRQYAGDLVMGQGCGRFRPSLSLAVPGEDGTLDGVALVTDLGEGTAHLAQLAVRPGVRGAGLGASLVTSVEALCAGAGFARLSLLVSESNRGARRLYARAGFTERAHFTCAARPERRSTPATLTIGQTTSA